MVEHLFRQRVQPLFNFIGKLLAQLPFVTPNIITLVALLSGVSAGISVAFDHCFAGLALLTISGLCDILDGTVARLTTNAQKVGAYFDLIADRMVEASVIVGFAYLYPQHAFACLFFFVALLLHFSTFVVAGSLFPNMGAKSMHYDVSLVERAEAFFVFGLMMIVPAHMGKILTILNVAIFAAGITRFVRVAQYARSL